jgi:hypothetical protein
VSNPNNALTVGLTVDNEVAIVTQDHSVALILSPEGALDLAEMLVKMVEARATELLTDERILDELLGGEES